MELTESWRDVFPASVVKRYQFCETRNAAAVLKATSPDAFQDVVDLLNGFELTVDKLTTPGGNKSVIARELDETMRQKGWREARYDQNLTTKLKIYRWTDAAVQEKTREVVSVNEYGGHKVDNVMNRAVLDVEWNPKDGNLDRDLANYVSLHEGGIIDVGIILTRAGGELRDFVRDLIAEVKAIRVPEEYESWRARIGKLANDPLGTSTTSNMDKLVPRIERGDGRGCPILAIAITQQCYVPPTDSIENEALRAADKLQRSEK